MAYLGGTGGPFNRLGAFYLQKFGGNPDRFHGVDVTRNCLLPCVAEAPPWQSNATSTDPPRRWASESPA
jgi:hypothetical protein